MCLYIYIYVFIHVPMHTHTQQALTVSLCPTLFMMLRVLVLSQERTKTSKILVPMKLTLHRGHNCEADNYK